MTVCCQTSNTGVHLCSEEEEKQLPLEQCLPRLWSFLSHNSGLVRQSVLRSLLVLTSQEEGKDRPTSNWLTPVLPEMLRLLLQRSLVENCPDTLQLIYQVWSQLVSHAPLGPLLTAACPRLGSWLCLLMHPAHLQVSHSFHGAIRGRQAVVTVEGTCDLALLGKLAK